MYGATKIHMDILRMMSIYDLFSRLSIHVNSKGKVLTNQCCQCHLYVCMVYSSSMQASLFTYGIHEMNPVN